MADKNNFKSFIWYDVWETLYNYLLGNWKEINEYDNDLVNKNLDVGEIWGTSQYFHWHCLPKIYQGDFDTTEYIVNRLNDFYEVYENDISLLLKLLLNTSLFIERRQFHDALNEIDKGIEFGKKTNQGLALVHMFSCEAHVYILQGNIDEAEKALARANVVRNEVDSAVPWQLSNFCRSRFEYDLCRLKESIAKNDKKTLSEYRKKAFKSGKKFLKQTRKVAQHRTESYRLIGKYYYLMNKKKKALKCWNRSIKEGQRLGARPELARTYFEVGKHMLEPESKFKELNGFKVEEYLKKARVLFEEMKLQWDMDELERLVSYG
jgi:tetratricopeptide (TPR) repeat protein